MSTFPIVYDNESIFSVTQRLISLNCGPSNRRSAQQLFSSASLQFCSAFPSNIPSLQSMSSIDAKVWISNHTILPIYRAFTPENRYQLAYEQLRSGNGEAVFKSLSLIANRQCVSNTFRFCAICAKEDELNLGLSYWHTVHQLPGYYVCHSHQTPLINQRITRKRFDNWPVIKSTNSQKAIQPLLALANFSRFFQYHYTYCGFKHSLKSIYFSAMRDKAYVTDGRQIRVKLIHHELKNYWLSLMKYPEVRSIFDSTRSPLFPSCLFLKKQTTIAPLKHLLLMAYLFKDINELRLYDKSMSNAEHLPAEPTTLSIVADEKTILKLLTMKLSLRSVAKSIGRSVVYVKQVALNHGMSIDSRAQQLFKTERNQIMGELKTGETTKNIAKRFDCSQGSIEQILSQDKNLVKHRCTLRKKAKRRKMRSALLSTLTSLPYSTRNEIKKNNNAAYMWLFKHDKEWLYAHLPAAIPRSQRCKKTE